MKSIVTKKYYGVTISIAIVLSLGVNPIYGEDDVPLKKEKIDWTLKLPENWDSVKNPFLNLLPKKQVVVPPAPRSDTSATNVKKIESTPQEPEIKPPKVMISGLVWNSDHPQALVNNKIVGPGDQIEGWTITGITESGVEISTKGKTHLIVPDFDATNNPIK